MLSTTIEIKIEVLDQLMNTGQISQTISRGLILMEAS